MARLAFLAGLHVGSDGQRTTSSDARERGERRGNLQP
jgi:hypothetical protein